MAAVTSPQTLMLFLSGFCAACLPLESHTSSSDTQVQRTCKPSSPMTGRFSYFEYLNFHPEGCGDIAFGVEEFDGQQPNIVWSLLTHDVDGVKWSGEVEIEFYYASDHEIILRYIAP